MVKKEDNDKSNKQISNEDIKILLNNKEEIESYEKYGLKSHEKDNLICFKLSYNFNEIKENNIFYIIWIKLLKFQMIWMKYIYIYD